VKAFALTDLPKHLHGQVLSQLHPRNTGPAPVVERNTGDGALGAGRAKGKDPTRVLVRVTAFRVRLLDEDNLCEKYHVDCCRYAGVIPGDAPHQTKIETTQQKVRTKDQERVLIEITTT
jgi:hypothetical protein